MSHTRGVISTDLANNFAGTLDTDLLAGGFEDVKTLTSGTTTVNVYKSPAANNEAGIDWYLFVRWVSGGTIVYLGVSEAFNSSTNLASKFVPYTISNQFITSGPAPDPDADHTIAGTYAPHTASLTTTNGMLWLGLQTTSGPINYELSATPDRLVACTRLNTNVARSVYAGCLENLLPQSVVSGDVQIGLFNMRSASTLFSGFATNTSTTTSDQRNSTTRAHLDPASINTGSTAATQGGFTREPNIAETIRGNFVGVVNGTSSLVSPNSAQKDERYTNAWRPTRVSVFSTRLPAASITPFTTGYNEFSSPRGVMIDVLTSTIAFHSSLSPAVGTEITVDGNVYSLVRLSQTNAPQNPFQEWDFFVLVGPEGS